MSENHIISFTTESNVRYNSDFDVVNCEKVYRADIDGDGQQEIIIPRTNSSNGRFMAEIAVYDFDTPSAGFDTSRFSGLLNPAPQSKEFPNSTRKRRNVNFDLQKSRGEVKIFERGSRRSLE